MFCKFIYKNYNNINILYNLKFIIKYYINNKIIKFINNN